jgi:hypothetical protein
MNDEFPDPEPIEGSDTKDTKIQTERDQRFVALFQASGFNLAKREELAVVAGFPPGRAARGNAGRVIKALVNNKKMQKALKDEGVDFKRLAGKLNELLDCEHPAFEGRADNMAQLKAVEMSIRVKDAFPPTKVDIDKSERKEIIVSGEVIQRLERFQSFGDIETDVQAVTVRDASD